MLTLLFEKSLIIYLTVAEINNSVSKSNYLNLHCYHITQHKYIAREPFKSFNSMKIFVLYINLLLLFFFNLFDSFGKTFLRSTFHGNIDILRIKQLYMLLYLFGISFFFPNLSVKQIEQNIFIILHITKRLKLKNP